MRGPNITRGQSVEVPVLTIDIAPTLLDLAGIQDNNTLVTEMDGLSICPLVISKNGSNDTSSNMLQVFIVVSYGQTVNTSIIREPQTTRQ